MIIIIIERYINGERISREQLKAVSISPITVKHVTSAIQTARKRVKGEPPVPVPPNRNELKG